MTEIQIDPRQSCHLQYGCDDMQVPQNRCNRDGEDIDLGWGIDAVTLYVPRTRTFMDGIATSETAFETGEISGVDTPNQDATIDQMVALRTFVTTPGYSLFEGFHIAEVVVFVDSQIQGRYCRKQSKNNRAAG